MNHFQLPCDLLRMIMEYLHLKEMARLDTAIFNHTLRPLLLEAMHGMILPMYANGNSNLFSLRWILSKNILAKNIECETDNISPEMYQLLLNSQFILQSLSICTCDSLGHFPCLKRFILQSSNPKGINEFIASNSQLEVIELYCESPFPLSVCHSLACCRKLTQLTLCGNDWFSDVYLLALLENELRLCYLDIRDTDARDEDSIDRIFTSCRDLCYLAIDVDVVSLQYLEKCWCKIISPALESDDLESIRWGLECLVDNNFPDEVSSQYNSTNCSFYN